MRQSFRLKMVLLSGVLSSLLLAGFGFFAHTVLVRVGQDRIDRELRALADPQIRKEQPPGHWKRFDESLRTIYGDEASRQFVVLATRTNGELLHASPDWPAGLPRDAFPSPLPFVSTGRPGDPPPDAGRDPAGRTDPRRPRTFDAGTAHPPPPRQVPVRGAAFSTITGPQGAWRVLTIGNEAVTLGIALSLADLHAEARRLQRALLIGGSLGLLLIGVGGIIIGHAALQPIRRIGRTVESVTAQRLDARIPEGQADTEFRRLISLMNGMLERLERSFHQANRFSADAAHELKTPLAILQAQVERALQRAADGSPEQRGYAEQLDEIQRLKAILGKLLLLAQADAGRLRLGREPIDLARMVRAAADDARMLAPDRKTTVDVPPEAVTVRGDAPLLNLVIENLVSNAVKFGAQSGAIGFELRTGGDRAILRVSNTGRPIAAEDQGRLFERFSRGDKARTRDIDGSGLGLSLARELARAHSGELVLEQSNAQATIFMLTLPME